MKLLDLIENEKLTYSEYRDSIPGFNRPTLVHMLNNSHVVDDDFIYDASSPNAWGINILRDINRPLSPDLQKRLIARNTMAITSINNPDKLIVSKSLTDPEFIQFKVTYDDFVKEYFKDNSVLMNKWLRYADNIREMG